VVGTTLVRDEPVAAPPTSRAPDPEPAAPLGPRQVRLVFCGLMLALLLAALEQMIVATALPKIVGELHGLDKMSWAITAYLLTSTVGLPIYGKLGDLRGRKGVFQFAILVFVVGSALAGRAQTMDQLIAFRA
jgi:MFS family permease